MTRVNVPNRPLHLSLPCGVPRYRSPMNDPGEYQKVPKGMTCQGRLAG
jgi:hypothetical protein